MYCQCIIYMAQPPQIRGVVCEGFLKAPLPYAYIEHPIDGDSPIGWGCVWVRFAVASVLFPRRVGQ